MVRSGEAGVALTSQQEDLADTKKTLASDKKFLIDVTMDCQTKQKQQEANEKERADEMLALALQPRLKPPRGFPPKVPHICAAILMARDSSLEAREACRRVPGVPQGAHARVAALAQRVRSLLADDDVPVAPPQSAPAQPPPAPGPELEHLQQVLATGGLQVVDMGGPQGIDDLMHDLGLPPLHPVPMDASAPPAPAPVTPPPLPPPCPHPPAQQLLHCASTPSPPMPLSVSHARQPQPQPLLRIASTVGGMRARATSAHAAASLGIGRVRAPRWSAVTATRMVTLRATAPSRRRAFDAASSGIGRSSVRSDFRRRRSLPRPPTQRRAGCTSSSQP